MSVFGDIMNAIFGKKAEAAPAAPSGGTASSTSAPSTPSSPAQASPSQSAQASPAPSSSASSGTAAQAPSAAPSGTVDVAAILDQAVKAKKQKLNWRKSIVDLMKALDLDSSAAARKQLAKELHYTGDTSKSAQMNIWLHKQVMTKLAENGGKVPDDLKH